MLKVIDVNGQSTVALICDYCQQEIHNGDLAIYAWRIRRTDYKIADGTVYTLHKGVCDCSITDTDTHHLASMYDWYWEELSGLPGELIKSLNLTWDRAKGILPLVTEEDDNSESLEIHRKLKEWKDSKIPKDSAKSTIN